MRKQLIVIFIFIGFCYVMYAETNEPLIIYTQYINETGIMLSGGKEKGAMMMGRGSMKLDLSTEKLGLWDGGNLFIMGNVTHGRNFSETKIGDYQVASNIDAGDHIYIHELYYQQEMSDFCLKFGVQDLNVDFLVSENASAFLNSSFGVPSVIAHGIPAPIYPLTAMGVVFNYKVTNDISIKTSVYDGLPISFENNPYNTNWHINDKHGFQFFNEVALTSNLFKDKTTKIKLGFYHHTGIKDSESDFYDAYSQKNGYYLIIDNDIWDFNETKINLFTQITYSPSKKETDNNWYFGFGGLVVNPFKLLKDEYFGMALAYSKFNTTNYNYELAFEMFYKFKLCSVLSFQPDIQYIVNPGGNLNGKIDNAFVGFLRFILEY